jgi:hypothetical protein
MVSEKDSEQAGHVITDSFSTTMELRLIKLDGKVDSQYPAHLIRNGLSDPAIAHDK